MDISISMELKTGRAQAIPFLNDNASIILNTSFVNRRVFPQPASMQRVRRQCARWPGALLPN